MPRPRNDSPKAALTAASATIQKLMADPKTPVEVRARLAVKLAEWAREDLRSESQKIHLTEAAKAELREEGKRQYLDSMAAQMNAALAEAGPERSIYTAPVHADTDAD